MMRSRAATSLLLASLLAIGANSQNAPRHPLPPVGKIIAAREMTGARCDHTATILPDFKVLIVGGEQKHGLPLNTTEIYDPTSESFTAGGKMTVPRAGHIAAVLSDGKVLVAGGATRAGVPLASSEDYDPETNEFTPRGNMHARRVRPTAIVLRDGRVLVTGGKDGNLTLDSGETYDVLNGKWTLTGKMSSPRVGHSATLLSDGRVLIAGGAGLHSALATAEIFDPKTNRFRPAGKLLKARLLHTTGLLSDGKVLIAGGASQPGKSSPLDSTEIYDPAKHVSVDSGKLAESRMKLPDGFKLLDGRILIVGGAASGEVFDPKTGTFRTVAGTLDAARYDAAAIQLMDGSVRIFGGCDATGAGTAKTWIYRP